MKKLFSLSLVLLLSGMVSFAQEYLGSAAERRLHGATQLRYRQGGQLPDYIELNAQSVFPASQLKEWLKDHFRVNPDFSYIPLSGSSDKLNQYHQRCQQAYHDVPLFDAVFSLHSKENNVFAVNGTIKKDVIPENQVVLTEPQALVFALKKLPSTKYMWEIPGNEDFIKYITQNPDATYYPTAKLVLYPTPQGENDEYKYAYMFNVYSAKPLFREEIYIDAQTGDVLFRNDRIHTADSAGVAVTRYSGTQDIMTSFVENVFRLREAGRGLGIETYDLNQGLDYGSAVDFTDSDNYWDNVNNEYDEVATDAHWAAEMTYDYFFNVHNRNSIDGNGFKLVSYVHYDINFANAFWDGAVMTYGDGDQDWSPLTTVDICGHEITHGLTTFTSNLTYSYESGALNESYSDIFGACIEFYAKPSVANWTMGEDIGGIIRNMADPNAMGDPDTYMGNNWYSGSNDNGGVHTNSNVLNYWFYLLTEGGDGTNDNGDAYNVSGIGIEDAGAIAFRTNTIYLQPDYNYADARFYSIKSTFDLFGGCSPEHESVANAFYAVGVGPMYNPEVVAAFDASITSACNLPVEIAFTNTSSNGVHYLWNFGDGTTDTLVEPLHTYTSEGSYTVSLFVDGGNCGTDTLEMQAFIILDTPDNPVVTSASNCGGPASLTLTAMATDSVQWYTAPVGGSPFYTGTSYTTPVLTQTTHYYVDNSILQPDIHGGKPDNSGAGSNFNFWNTHYLEFDVYSPVIIKTVKVYAQGAGNRTISLLDHNDNLMNSATINIPNGESVITLNFEVPAGTAYRLQGPGTPNLYRNNGGINYPYHVGNVLTINTSDAGNDRYYYFYDWVVGQQSCSSERVEVSAFINYGDPVASFTYLNLFNGVQFNNTSVDGNTYLWDFGDGTTSTEKNPMHTYPAPDLYPVTLTVTNSCGDNTISQQVDVVAGLSTTDHVVSLSLSPVPARESLVMKVKSGGMSHAAVIVYDMLGNSVYEKNLGELKGDCTATLDVSGLQEGVYILGLQHDKGTVTRRFVVQ